MKRAIILAGLAIALSGSPLMAKRHFRFYVGTYPSYSYYPYSYSYYPTYTYYSPTPTSPTTRHLTITHLTTRETTCPAMGSTCAFTRAITIATTTIAKVPRFWGRCRTALNASG